MTSAVAGQGRMLYPRYRMLFLHINTWEDFGGNFYQISVFHSRTAGLVFCAVLPVCCTDIDVEWQSEHLLHYNPRWIQFLLCRISWEAPVGNIRRACKYHRHFEQFGARWGNGTSQSQCGSCLSEFKKALSKVLEKTLQKQNNRQWRDCCWGSAKLLLPIGWGVATKHTRVSCFEESIATGAAWVFPPLSPSWPTLENKLPL